MDASGRTPRRLPRRALLRQTVSALGFLASIPLLAACGSAAPAAPAAGATSPASASGATPAAAAPPTGGSAGKLTLPTYVPIELVTPDLPGTAAGVDPAYLTFPKALVKSVSEAPSHGGDVDVFTRVILAAPPAVEANQAWQAVNRAIGANMKLNMVPTAEYNTKLATTIASTDIPDMVFLSSLQILGIPQFLQKACADLTPYVAGDAVKDYPNLANIPPIAWKQTVYNNGIYGVPIPRPYVQGIWYVNQSRFESIGAGQPKDGAEFKQILQQLTNPSASQWGISGDASYAFGLTGITSVPQLAMFRAPNNWKVDSSGKFIKDIETDEFKAALAYTRDLWASGVFYADALTTTSSENKLNLVAGRFAVYPDGWFSYPAEYWDRGLKLNPPVKFRTLHPFSNDGGAPIWHQYQAFNGMTAIKQGSPERIKEMLRILNYLAAPFGSEEAFLLEFGVKDVDYTLDANGNPVLTAQGQADTTVSWRYMAQRPQILFDANDPEFARVAHADEETIIPVIIPDPSLGLISTTNQSKSGVLLKNFTDALVDFVVGRRPLSDYDSLVSDWRSNGGEQMRTEFQQAYAAQA
ncbi:MAG: extracellular solute-binding protein [Chloroflexi bacterium]|nr:extracellular solute-binding protein [Chloroflexota bacterium]